MKNKVISAMLLGMSATMAVPGTVVMAAEDGSESTAVEEAAAEVPETEGGESEESEESEVSQDEQDAETAVQEMIDYATDESAKVADTPDNFGPELTNIVFTDDVYGRYADSLNEYINGSEVDTDSIYNCEMDMVNKVAELTKDESAEAIAASKYQVALTFEGVYGEDAFMPGRDIRRALIADSSKDEDFATCGTIAEADTVYISAGGTTAIPATLFKAVSEQPESPVSRSISFRSKDSTSSTPVTVLVFLLFTTNLCAFAIRCSSMKTPSRLRTFYSMVMPKLSFRKPKPPVPAVPKAVSRDSNTGIPPNSRNTNSMTVRPK